MSPAWPRPMRAPMIVGAVTLAAFLAACGTPPAPDPTAPPEASGSANIPSGAVPPPSWPVVPTAPGIPVGPPSYPGGAVTYPTPPTATTQPQATVPTTSATPTPKPAGTCTAGPSKQRVLSALKGQPGIPSDAQLDVVNGPFCAGSWQFTEVGLVGQDIDPLQVVTTGKPATPTVVAAGGDVCVDQVEKQAPPGIRVLACGF
ncbi:hypothetical protein [Mangrovihabitans endophyticus]|uniref:Uncharacterized protein n=1 Tax=Mangrovihabitans endophyticus TaxID=1751298 RepID=A0A8J3BYW5_9ACTN|nr:hypothetical protein [Mangrovihabitans endophyticus]GGK93786.1 hypothetical protein GCM10012284_29710 [Mangrovihabitans endophyticus]